MLFMFFMLFIRSLEVDRNVFIFFSGLEFPRFENVITALRRLWKVFCFFLLSAKFISFYLSFIAHSMATFINFPLARNLLICVIFPEYFSIPPFRILFTQLQRFHPLATNSSKFSWALLSANPEKPLKPYASKIWFNYQYIHKSIWLRALILFAEGVHKI